MLVNPNVSTGVRPQSAVQRLTESKLRPQSAVATFNQRKLAAMQKGQTSTTRPKSAVGLPSIANKSNVKRTSSRPQTAGANTGSALASMASIDSIKENGGASTGLKSALRSKSAGDRKASNMSEVSLNAARVALFGAETTSDEALGVIQDDSLQDMPTNSVQFPSAGSDNRAKPLVQRSAMHLPPSNSNRPPQHEGQVAFLSWLEERCSWFSWQCHRSNSLYGIISDMQRIARMEDHQAMRPHLLECLKTRFCADRVRCWIANSDVQSLVAINNNRCRIPLTHMREPLPMETRYSIAAVGPRGKQLQATMKKLRVNRLVGDKLSF